MKRPSETHPATREERGHSERLRSLLSALRAACAPSRSILHPLFVFLLLLSSSSRDLASFAETGYGNWRNHDPLCPSRGRFQPRIPLTFRIQGIKHFAREIKRDSRRLVNTGTGWSFIRFCNNTNTCNKISFFPLYEFLWILIRAVTCLSDPRYLFNLIKIDFAYKVRNTTVLSNCIEGLDEIESK